MGKIKGLIHLGTVNNDGRGESMKKKRVLFLSIILLSILFGLIGRLMQVQLVQTESFSKHKINLIESSVEQRTQQIVIDEGRGAFLDRAGNPLTFDEENVVVLFPFLNKIEWPSATVASILGMDEADIKRDLLGAKEPVVLKGSVDLTQSQMDRVNALEVQGVFAVKKKVKKSVIPAAQLIGVTGENTTLFHERYPDRVKGANQPVGVSGLQGIFDEWLIAEEQAKLVYHVDATGGPLFGADVKYVASANPFYPLNVKTTIDSRAQEALEEVADKYEMKKGGLLLLDIASSEIVASVSRPKMKQGDPFGEGATDYMRKALIPGSVFKTVIAAASLEEGMVDETRMFDCDQNIRGGEAQKPHGSINIRDSLAASCNRTFADLANELTEKDQDLIEEYADKLGLTGDVAWKGDVFHYEDFSQLKLEQSRIFASETAKGDRNEIAMTGIGQNEVRVTPIGMANMMATIARGGKAYEVSAVSTVEYQNGADMVNFPKQEGGEGISPFTAMKMQQYLRGVVNSPLGTAPYLQEAAYEVAGKTGTAQTGSYRGEHTKANELYNKWFAGYFPFHDPKYALVAVNMDVLVDEGGIYPIFKDSVDALYRLDQE